MSKVELVDKPDGLWVKVTFANGTTWLPALADLAWIMNLIGQCEDVKYPGGKGRRMTLDFLRDCFNGGVATIPDMLKKYQFPAETVARSRK